jgi:hypothetical protein
MIKYPQPTLGIGVYRRLGKNTRAIGEFYHEALRLGQAALGPLPVYGLFAHMGFDLFDEPISGHCVGSHTSSIFRIVKYTEHMISIKLTKE